MPSARKWRRSSRHIDLVATQAFAYQQGPALAMVLPGADELTDEQLREAASLCPVEAIRLFDADGNDVTPES
jgi:hypothetical protein